MEKLIHSVSPQSEKAQFCVETSTLRLTYGDWKRLNDASEDSAERCEVIRML